MKHKLTVLACVGLALLLSTGFAFAQANNTITIESKNVNRCSDATVGINLINGDAIGCIGLPLKVTGGTVTSAVATARLAGWTLAQNGLPGASFLLNAVGPDCNALLPGAGNIYSLTVPIPSACTGTIEIDTAFFAPAGAVVLLSDCCPVEYAFNKGVLTLDDQQPVCGVNPDVTLDWQSAIVDKLLMATDPDACDGLVYSLVSSPGSIAPGTNKYSWDPGCPEVATSPHTITFKATDPCGEFATCSFQVTVTQQGPVCATVSAQTIHWLGTLSILLPATDDGCPGALGWTLNTVVPPVVGTLSINPTTGRLTFSPKCDDIATSPHVVTYTVSDGVKTCQSTVSITVTNAAPVITVCSDVIGSLIPGDLITNDIDATDGNLDPISYSLLLPMIHSGIGPGTPNNDPTINPLTGLVSWQTESANNNDLGDWTVTVVVSDGCAADTCSFQISVVFNFTLCIGGAPLTTPDPTLPSYVVDTIPTLNGQTACAFINIHDGYALGGLDLLIGYDKTGLSMTSVTALDELANWEYFTYRTGVDGNCGTGCPSGIVHIVALADLDNGPSVHPDFSDFYLDGNIVQICFVVTSDRNFIGQCLPIYFFWSDCTDNLLSSYSGDTVFAAQATIFDPTCLSNEKPGHLIRPIIDFCNASICIKEPPDDRGDINLDGVANSIADAVLFSRYFIYGIGEFEDDALLRAVQVLATDINDDGVVLTVADLVYLVRIITGDATPFPAGENPKLTPYQNHADAVVNVGANRVSVTTNSAVDLGGAVFTFRYSGLTVGDAVLGNAASQMIVKSNADRGELRVLVAPPMDAKGARINAGINEIVSIPTTGEGTIELVSVEIADAQGALLSTNLSRGVPSEYALLQNYPNPFNAGTVIQFSLKDQADWKLNVYNITGQTVRSFSGNGAGQVQVAWDGNDNTGNAIASGVYFYRLETKAFTATKKMTLMK